jgi:tetratricopeptide (TPR) repeat protein
VKFNSLQVRALCAQETLRQIEARAAALKNGGDAAGALAAFEKAAALDPGSPRLQDEIGFLLAVLNRREEASQRFERSLELNPKFAPAHYHLGVACWIEQRPEQAIAHLESAVALDPGNAE